MLILLPVPLLLLLFIALALTYLGLRGRVINDYPLCRRCHFDLIGLTSPTICPECGRDLSAPRAIRIGQRRRRRVPLTFGILTLALLLGIAGAFVVGRARGFNWNTIKPDWMLEAQAKDTSDPVAANSALIEISKRVAGDKVDKDRAARLVSLGLAYQSEQTAPWLVGWGDLIEAARAANLVTEPQWMTYAQHAFPVTTIILPDAVAGKFDIGVRAGPVRLGQSPALQGRFQIQEVIAIGGGSASVSESAATASVSGNGTMMIIIQQVPLEFPKSGGDMTVRATWLVSAQDKNNQTITEWTEDPPAVVVKRPASSKP